MTQKHTVSLATWQKRKLFPESVLVSFFVKTDLACHFELEPAWPGFLSRIANDSKDAVKLVQLCLCREKRFPEDDLGKDATN